MTNKPTANTRFAELDDQHRRFDGPLTRTAPLTGGWHLAMQRDGEHRMAACRRAIARRREAVAGLDPSADPVLSRLADRLEDLRTAQIAART